jgi:prepilin-type processing-associated H-X9-DG protein
VGVSERDPRGVWAMGFPGSSVTAGNAIGNCTVPNDTDDESDDIEGGPQFWYLGIGTRDRMGVAKGIANLGFPSCQAQARSLHRGGVNVCFADGHVRFISNRIAQCIWLSLLSGDDGGFHAACFLLNLDGELGEHVGSQLPPVTAPVNPPVSVPPVQPPLGLP